VTANQVTDGTEGTCAGAQLEHFVCKDCGPHTKADEDGCCAYCGRDCKVEPCKPTLIAQVRFELEAEAHRCAILSKALRLIRDARANFNRDWMIAIATNALNGEDTGP
jgi:hypothetical protein